MKLGTVGIFQPPAATAFLNFFSYSFRDPTKLDLFSDQFFQFSLRKVRF